MTQYQHYQPMHMALHERCFPHTLMEGVWLWSVYSEEKTMYFNGYLVQTGEQEALITDPPCGGPDVLESFAALPRPTCILLTNADHEREAELFKAHFNIPVYCPEPDTSLLSHRPDFTYQDGHTFPGGWRAIHLPDQKTPGESALYHEGRKLLILGDALIGKPYQRLSMLPPEKYRNPKNARLGLQRLQELEVSAILPGDGDPILLNPTGLITEAIRE